MPEEIITLLPEDDIVSVLDHLNWSAADRMVFQLPDSEADIPVFTGEVDLVRLRRAADRQRRQVGLITGRREIHAWATAAGLPIFDPADEIETQDGRWRRGRRAAYKAGLNPNEIAAHHQTRIEEKRLAGRRLRRPGWEYWVKRFLAITSIAFLAAGLVIGAVYLVPSGEIRLYPYTESIQTELELTAATAVTAAETTAQQVPARLETVSTTWTTEIATTGAAMLPDSPGRGQIVLTNLSVDSLVIPAGTLVYAEAAGDRIPFQTVQPVTLPEVVGGTAAIDIVAINQGESGNVAAETITSIESPFDERVDLRNPAPTSGGAVRPVPAVSAADRERLRAQLSQYLQTQAIDLIESGLSNQEFLARESLRLQRVISEDWSHEVGQAADSLALTLTAEISGVVIDTNPALDLVYNRLVQTVPPGYDLLPDSFQVTSGEVKGMIDAETVRFTVQGRGEIASKIDIEDELGVIAGHEIDEAMIYLQNQLLLESRPTATVFPNWFGRLPYLPGRIEVVVVES